VAFGLAPGSFFLSPTINFFTLESQKVTHAGVRQRMFVIGTLGLFHDSRSRGLALCIDDLPVAS
jgi:hypothetical protein